MKRIVFTCAVVLFTLSIDAHPWKPRHHLIIDTDGGHDDMKAISMLLASPDVHVLAITTSSGILSAENAWINTKSLLNSYFHEGIPVGINRKSVNNNKTKISPPDFKWGDESGLNHSAAPDAILVISEMMEAEEGKITFVSLGGLSTAAAASKEIPGFENRVSMIVWSCNGLKDKSGYNYSIDKTSSELILNADIPVKAVTGAGDLIFYDGDLISSTGNINTRYAKKIVSFLNSETASKHKFSFVAFDELVPLFLHFPDLFSHTISGNNSESNIKDLPALKEGFKKIVKGETVVRNQVMKELPVNPQFYFEDLEPYVTGIIEKYGMDEWQSGVIANELHRHLGVYAIIGVKMGIRAREYFNVGVDEFEATTFAGSAPPLSCMNDGIQVSTGSTPGHGLLKVINDNPSPVVEFKHMNKKIRLTLKPDINSRISGELKEINFIHGLDSDIYWELVRKNAIKYWQEMDRHEIFIIERIE